MGELGQLQLTSLFFLGIYGSKFEAPSFCGKLRNNVILFNDPGGKNVGELCVGERSALLIFFGDMKSKLQSIFKCDLVDTLGVEDSILMFSTGFFRMAVVVFSFVVGDKGEAGTQHTFSQTTICTSD